MKSCFSRAETLLHPRLLHFRKVKQKLLMVSLVMSVSAQVTATPTTSSPMAPLPAGKPIPYMQGTLSSPTTHTLVGKDSDLTIEATEYMHVIRGPREQGLFNRESGPDNPFNFYYDCEMVKTVNNRLVNRIFFAHPYTSLHQSIHADWLPEGVITGQVIITTGYETLDNVPTNDGQATRMMDHIVDAFVENEGQDVEITANFKVTVPNFSDIDFDSIAMNDWPTDDTVKATMAFFTKKRKEFFSKENNKSLALGYDARWKAPIDKMLTEGDKFLVIGKSMPGDIRSILRLAQEKNLNLSIGGTWGGHVFKSVEEFEDLATQHPETNGLNSLGYISDTLFIAQDHLPMISTLSFMFAPEKTEGFPNEADRRNFVRPAMAVLKFPEGQQLGLIACQTPPPQVREAFLESLEGLVNNATTHGIKELVAETFIPKSGTIDEDRKATAKMGLKPLTSQPGPRLLIVQGDVFDGESINICKLIRKEVIAKKTDTGS